MECDSEWSVSLELLAPRLGQRGGSSLSWKELCFYTGFVSPSL